MTTLRTHPAYPLSAINRKLYLRLHRARRRRAQSKDVAERLQLGYQIGELTQQIRRLGMQR